MEWRNLGGMRMEMRSLRLHTIVVIAMMAIDAIWTPAVLLLARFAPAFFATALKPIAGGVDDAQTVFTIATMLAFAWWIHRAGSNLETAGVEALEFTPAARIWWLFVPFANLMKPFQGMRELWNASRGIWPCDTGEALVSTWWVLWLADGVLSNAALRGGLETLLWASCVVGVVLAGFASAVIRGIADGQERLAGGALAEVFA